MKITIVTGAFFPVPPIMGGAVEKVWFALGQEFARRGHEVVNISRAHRDLAKAERLAGVSHIRVAGFNQPRSIIWLKFLDLVYSLRVRRVLPEADILVTNTFWLPIIERRRTSGLVYVHVARHPKWQMRLYGNAARLQAVSHAIADSIVERAPQWGEKIRAIPNPLPFNIEPSFDAARSETILFVGRIHPEKGLELLLRATCALSTATFNNWNLKIVGPHESRFGGGGNDFLYRMQQLSKESRIPVQWLGAIFSQSKLLEQYRSAAIFVYPSVAESGEAFGIAPVEAMANGCVPLVSDLAVFREYIVDGVTGFVFDHRGERAVQNLADRLSQLLRFDQTERRKIADAARAKAAEFALEPVAQRYLDDFATLLAQAKK